MPHVVFDELSRMVAPLMAKKEMKIIQPITPTERLCVILRYLVTDDALVMIDANYRMRPVVISQIEPETCNAIWKVLVENNYTEEPTTQAGWCKVAERFYKNWNFPNVADTSDGKHILIQAPPCSGSVYFIYEKNIQYCFDISMRFKRD